MTAMKYSGPDFSQGEEERIVIGRSGATFIIPAKGREYEPLLPFVESEKALKALISGVTPDVRTLSGRNQEPI